MQKLFKKNYNKVGILGGTFDPPHKGHLHISKIALKELKLDKLIWRRLFLIAIWSKLLFGALLVWP